MATRRKIVPLGAGRYITKTGLTRAGVSNHNLGTVRHGPTFTKSYHKGKSIQRSITSSAGTRKSISQGDKKLIVGSLAWNQQRRRKGK